MRPTRLLALASLVLLPTLAACGSSDSDEAGPDPTSPAPSAPATDPPTTDSPVTDPPATDAPQGIDWPAEEVDVVIDDGTFGSVAEMGDESDLVVVGEVVEVESIGRLTAAEDPAAPEYVAVTIRPSETLRGTGSDDIVLAWAAFDVGSDGERVATRILNGLRPPDVGDRVLVFADAVDPAFAELAGGVPTHQLVKLDGMAYLDGDQPVAAEVGSPAAEALLTMTLDDIRADLAS
jgi:hypothetical protein